MLRCFEQVAQPIRFSIATAHLFHYGIRYSRREEFLGFIEVSHDRLTHFGEMTALSKLRSTASMQLRSSDFASPADQLEAPLDEVSSELESI